MQWYGAGIMEQSAGVSFCKGEENQTVLEWRRREAALAHFSMPPAIWSHLFHLLWGTSLFRKNPARWPTGTPTDFHGLQSESVFDSNVSKYFLPWMRSLTSSCSCGLPLFSSPSRRAGSMPSRNWAFCYLFAFLGKDVVLESAQQFLTDRQSVFGSDIISLHENSSLYVPPENMASYLSSVGVQGDIPLNLSSSTDNNQWCSFQDIISLPPIQASTGLNVKKQKWLRNPQENYCDLSFWVDGNGQ